MSLTATDFDFVRTLVRRDSAIVLDDDKAYLAETRLGGLARREGYASTAELVTRLRGGSGDLRRKVVEAMTTNETSFFRDVNPFEALRRRVLPDLLAARQGVRQLRIWSAACSTGQEPYSLAVTLREHFPQLATWEVKILATDLSTEVLDKARQGVYSQLEVNRGLPAAQLIKYFDRSGVNWRVKEEVRRMVEFRPLNLIEPWPDLGAPDIVLIRNVLIYFDIPTKRDILGRVRRILRPDGFVLLGGAESTLNIDDGYERVEAERSSVYRHRHR